MEELRFRQVHMDFHTSEKIPGVAGRFDADSFAETLSNAHVNSVTCFARCHHGLLYYDSKELPELVHPELKERNLLEKQINACHARNIKVPVYTTVQWDYASSTKHPEWCCLTPEGSLLNYCRDGESAPVYEAGFYRTLCVNTPYRDFLKKHIADIFAVLTPEKIDGFFLDIVNVVDCSCPHCVKGMQEQGYDPTKKQDRIQYAREMITQFKLDLSSFIRTYKSDASIFYNAGHINGVAVDGKEAYTHWELESLPSGQWGYSHFPNTVRYARTTGLDCVTHTGKFHTEWGDFHSFKNPEALQYECFRMLAYNSKCLVGDQLDPDGKISPDVYKLVGSVYSEVERKEPWCSKATAVVDIGIVTSEYLSSKSGAGGKVPDEVNGACTMLDEMGYQFNIVDNRSDFSSYKVLVLPDTILCDQVMADKINRYVEQGGKLIVTAKSGLNSEQDCFVLDCLGVEYVGNAPYSPDFIVPGDVIGKNLPKTEHVMYLQGVQVKVKKGTVMAKTYIPYFNRTWEHFCSHRHTPSSHQYGYPGVVRNENSIYFMHPVFRIYNEKHPRWCKEIIKDALTILLPEPVLRHNGPTTLVTTLNEQVDKQRYILHALHYVPLKSSTDLFTIEDVIPLYDLKFDVHVTKSITSVKLVPELQELPFQRENNHLRFVIPKVHGHAMIELDYADK